MSLILSNAFKGLLLSSYVNMRFDLAAKSLQDLIDKPSVGIIYNNFSLRYIEEPKIVKLLKRRDQRVINLVKIFSDDKDVAKLRSGQTVILCSSYSCPFYIAMNPHLKLVNTNDHKFHSFGCLKISKSHSHSKQIYKM